MVIAQFIKTRVSSQTKRRVQAAAQQQLVTELIWLRQQGLVWRAGRCADLDDPRRHIRETQQGLVPKLVSALSNVARR